MKSSEALNFKNEHVPFHNPVGHSLAHTPSSLQAVAVHSCTDKIVCNLVRFPKDPSAVRGEGVGSVEEEVVGGVLQDRQSPDSCSYVGFKVDPVLLLDCVLVRINSMFGYIPRSCQCLKRTYHVSVSELPHIQMSAIVPHIVQLCILRLLKGLECHENVLQACHTSFQSLPLDGRSSSNARLGGRSVFRRATWEHCQCALHYPDTAPACQ